MAVEPGRIEPRLTGFDTAMVVVSLVIGIGIFRTPAIVAGAAETARLFFAAWALGGLISLLGALTYAEIGSRFPRAGGYYKVVADLYHPALAFMLNWAQALMQGAGAAGVAFIGADYLNPLVLPAAQCTPRASLTTAVALMLVLLTVNYLGIRFGARTQNVLSLLKIAMIVALAAAAFALAPASGPPAEPPAGGSWKGLAAALIPVLYAFGGYQNTMNLGGDVKDARHRLPRAVIAGMGIVTGLYLLINFAYHHVLGIAGVAGTKLVAAAVARASFGPAGQGIVSLAIFLSAAGFVNATVMQVPRSFYAMAEDGALPRLFLRVNGRTQVQELGLLFFGATMLVPAFLLGSFEKLLNYVMFSDSLMLVVVASTIFVLRPRNAGGNLAFRMPGYPVFPGLFLLCQLGVALHVLVTEPRIAMAGIAILLFGAPLFFGMRRVSARHASPSR